MQLQTIQFGFFSSMMGGCMIKLLTFGIVRLLTFGIVIGICYVVFELTHD